MLLLAGCDGDALVFQSRDPVPVDTLRPVQSLPGDVATHDPKGVDPTGMDAKARKLKRAIQRKADRALDEASRALDDLKRRGRYLRGTSAPARRRAINRA